MHTCVTIRILSDAPKRNKMRLSKIVKRNIRSKLSYFSPSLYCFNCYLWFFSRHVKAQCTLTRPWFRKKQLVNKTIIFFVTHVIHVIETMETHCPMVTADWHTSFFFFVNRLFRHIMEVRGILKDLVWEVVWTRFYNTFYSMCIMSLHWTMS